MIRPVKFLIVWILLIVPLGTPMEMLCRVTHAGLLLLWTEVGTGEAEFVAYHGAAVLGQALRCVCLEGRPPPMLVKEGKSD